MVDTLPLVRSQNRVLCHRSIDIDIEKYPRVQVDDIGFCRHFDCIDGTVQTNKYQFKTDNRAKCYWGWPARYNNEVVFVVYLLDEDRLFNATTGAEIITLPVINDKHYHG